MNLNIKSTEKVGEQINDRLILPDDEDTTKYSRRADGTSFSYKNNYGEELWTANVSRLVAACRELNTFGLLLGRDLGHGPIPISRRGRSPARKRR